jgi:hypothetical protein
MSKWSVVAIGTERAVGLFAATDQLIISGYRFNINLDGVCITCPDSQEQFYFPKKQLGDITNLLPEISFRPCAVQLS